MVTISDLLHLPTLREATVLAGHRGLNKPVTSISVLEYSGGDQYFEDFFNKNSFTDSELVITAFANVPNDFPLQCNNIRALHQVGEAGLILYYVGIFMPEVHESLLKVANELDFPLICMPKNRFDFRYSEVIGEVMEAILHDKLQQTEALLSGQSADLAVSTLLHTIVRDEPLKMRRLADVLHIDVAGIHGMWVIQSDGRDWHKTALELLRTSLKIHCNTVVADEFEGYVVALFDDDRLPSELGFTILSQLDEQGIHATMSECRNLTNTTEVRTTYLLSRKHLNTCRQVWPDSRRFNLQELQFIDELNTVVMEGEAAVNLALSSLNPIFQQRDQEELIATLTTHMLDCDCSVTRTANAMFLHKNTIKYRLGRLTEIMGYPVTKRPESFALYRAIALHRMIRG